MRVNVDAAALRDPRIKMLARTLSISLPEAIGRILHVWFVCYERRSAVLPAIEIDISGDLEGFADAMLSAGLAEQDESGVYVRGVTERIEFLEKQRERGKMGGRPPSRPRSQNHTNGNQTVLGLETTGLAVSKPNGLGSENQPLKRVKANSPDLTLTQAPDLDQDHGAPPNPTEPGSSEPRSDSEPAAALKADPPADALALAAVLMGHILDNHKGNRMHKWPERQREATVHRWAITIERLHRIDGRSWGEIQGMITWCQRDSFWSGVILGAENLRDKWDTMTAQRSRKPQSSRASPAVDFEQTLDDAAREIDQRKGKERPDDDG